MRKTFLASAENVPHLHVHDLRSPFGFNGSGELTAYGGIVIKLRPEVGDRFG